METQSKCETVIRRPRVLYARNEPSVAACERQGSKQPLPDVVLYLDSQATQRFGLLRWDDERIDQIRATKTIVVDGKECHLSWLPESEASHVIDMKTARDRAQLGEDTGFMRVLDIFGAGGVRGWLATPYR